MSATDPLEPPSEKGAIRAAMWEDAMGAHRAGRIRTTELRASDFFGPGLGANAHLGDRFVPRLIAGARAWTVGRVDQAHSWTYIDDVCRALVVVGSDDRSLGRAWHVPTLDPKTVSEMAVAICGAAGASEPKVTQIPRLALHAAGMFSSDLRALYEIQYQHERPFVMESAETTEVFGLDATPFAEQVAATVASYRNGQTAGTTSSSAPAGSAVAG